MSTGRPETALLRLVVLDDYLGLARELGDWDRLGPRVRLEVLKTHVEDFAELAALLRGVPVVCLMRERTDFSAELIDTLPDLRLIVTSGMANAAIDVAAANVRGIVVSGTSSLVHPTVELTWGLIIALARGIVRQELSQRGGGWQTEVGYGLHGRRLGVLGLGRNGSEVARIGLAFGMKVVAWSPNLTDERAAAIGAERLDLESLLETSDVVTIHLRLGDSTRGLIGRQELQLMPKHALLINTSRGPIVEEASLIRALREGWIGGAGLDVYDEEPMQFGHPLLGLTNVVLTPHLGYVTQENMARFYREMVEDIEAYLAGEPIRVLTVPT